MTDTTPNADAAPGADAEQQPAGIRPRLRVAAIVWGLVLAAAGVGLIWLVGSSERMSAVTRWIVEATPSAWAVVAIAAVLVVGLVILIGSLLGAVHRAQDRARARS